MAIKITHVGFSGTREGMNDFQKDKVACWLKEFMLRSQVAEDVWFHHGDCIGADAEAHMIAQEYGYYIHKHPPLDEKYSAHMSCDKEDPPYSYHGRNQRIVKACDVLIATPKRVSGGGTWYTIQCAINMKKPHIIIHSDRIELIGLS